MCVAGSSWRRGVCFFLLWDHGGPPGSNKLCRTFPLMGKCKNFSLDIVIHQKVFLSLSLFLFYQGYWTWCLHSRTFLLTSSQNNFLPLPVDWNGLLQCYTPDTLLRPQTIGPNFFNLCTSHTQLATLHSWELYSFLHLIILCHLDILSSSLTTCRFG